jgi:hypothetical protein
MLGYYAISIVGSSCLNFGFILHIPYVVVACALPSILPSLSLTDDVLYTGEETDAGVGLGRRRRLLDVCISLLCRFETCTK